MTNTPKTYRLARNMTQKELAEKAGMSEGYLREWEAGRKTNISAKLLDQWRLALGISACAAMIVANPTHPKVKCKK